MKQDQQLPHDVHEHIDVNVITNLVQKTIALNHDGVICLESNKIKSAIKIFTTAYNTHEKLKIKMNMNRNRNNRSNRRTTASSVTVTAAVIAAAVPAPPAPSSYHNNNVNELFYQYRRAPSASSSESSSSESVSSSSSSSSSSSVESASSLSCLPSLDEVMDLDLDLDCDDNNNIHRIDLEEAPPAAPAAATTVILDIEDEIVFRDSIRLPFYEDIFPTTTSTLIFEPTNEDLQQEQHPAFSFLSTAHALNLAIAHHLRGIELLKHQRPQQRRRIILPSVSTDTDSTTSTPSTTRRSRRSGATEQFKKHFDKACRLYEQTMNIERIRSKFNTDQQDSLSSSSSSSSWFSPQILLACLNNLGHIHSLLSSSSSSRRRSQEQEQCHQYYNRLQSTVHTLVISTMASTSSAPSLARKSMQLSRSMPWMNLIREVNEEDSNNGDNDANCDTTTTRNDIDIEDTYTYLELFWTNSFHGLNRLSTAITVLASQQQQQNNVRHSRNDKSTPRTTSISMPSSTASVSTTSSVSPSVSVSAPTSITIPKRAAAQAAAASVAA